MNNKTLTLEVFASNKHFLELLIQDWNARYHPHNGISLKEYYSKEGKALVSFSDLSMTVQALEGLVTHFHTGLTITAVRLTLR